MRVVSWLCIILGYTGIIMSIGLSLGPIVVTGFISLVGGYSLHEIIAENPDLSKSLQLCILGGLGGYAVVRVGRALRKQGDTVTSSTGGQD